MLTAIGAGVVIILIILGSFWLVDNASFKSKPKPKQKVEK